MNVRKADGFRKKIKLNNWTVNIKLADPPRINPTSKLGSLKFSRVHSLFSDGMNLHIPLIWKSMTRF